MTPIHSRRAFLSTAVRAGLAWPVAAAGARLVAGAEAAVPPGGLAPLPTPAASTLAERFSDLRRHFIFDFYPWYGGPPDYVHWDYLDRHPPLDISSNYMPRLGPYDSRARAVPPMRCHRARR